MCKCEKEAYDKEQQETQNKEKQIRLESLIKNSLMDASFQDCAFENWDFNLGTKQMYNVGIKYADKFKEFKSTGAGLLIHGEPGNGKTHLSCCIANRLLQNHVPVICVSIIALLELIKGTYNYGSSEGESNILQGLKMADLLIIDDLGTEQDSKWSVPMIYNIIDSRYRSKLPLIITSNLKIDPKKTNGILADKYDRRTEDRILEMCTPILNDGPSIRLEEAKKRTEALRNILGGN